MFEIFRDRPFNQPIGTWDVSSVTDMIGMFYESSFNHPINRWCVTKITTEPIQFSLNSPLTPPNKTHLGYMSDW